MATMTENNQASGIGGPGISGRHLYSQHMGGIGRGISSSVLPGLQSRFQSSQGYTEGDCGGK